MQIDLIDDCLEHLPERIVLKLVSYHRAGGYARDHLRVVRPDEGIDPKERISLASNPQLSGNFG
jgi:hypothetical protein